MQLAQYEETERALGQANLLDDEDPVTWGYLCKVLLLQGGSKRYVKARQCLDRSLRLHLADAALLTEIGCVLLSSYYLDSPTLLAPRMVTSEPLACFKAASSILRTSSLSVESVESAILRTFEGMRTKGDNRLDSHLQAMLTASEAEVLGSLTA
jgi:hypothetical protein